MFFLKAAIVANFPNFVRAGDLLASVMLFLMYTGSENYDLYAFTPALRSFYAASRNTTQHAQFETLVNFLDKEFTIEEYAPNFKFSDTETADQFLLRFLEHLESKKSIPQDVKNSILALESYKDTFVNPFETKGFIKPLPLYIFTRITSLIAELSYGLKPIINDDHLDSLETIIKFLTRDFEPKVHGKGLDLDNEDIHNVPIVVYFGFVAQGDKSKRLILADGVQGSTKNKEFLEHILPKVPRKVQNAIKTILPYL